MIKTHRGMFTLGAFRAAGGVYYGFSEVFFAWRALGNFELACETDEAELPDTPVQRFLAQHDACLHVREFYVRDHTNIHQLLWLCGENEFGVSWFCDGDYDNLTPDDLVDFYHAWVRSGEKLTAEEYFG